MKSVLFRTEDTGVISKKCLRVEHSVPRKEEKKKKSKRLMFLWEKLIYCLSRPFISFTKVNVLQK